MIASKAHARAGLVLLLAGSTILLLAIALVRRAQRVTFGGEIAWDGFGFRVLGIEAAEPTGRPANEVAADGRSGSVRFEVLSEAKRVDPGLDGSRALLLDAHRHDDDERAHAMQAWREGNASSAVLASIARDETCVLDLAYDPRGLTLRIRWGASVVDFVDQLVFGDGRLAPE